MYLDSKCIFRAKITQACFICFKKTQQLNLKKKIKMQATNCFIFLANSKCHRRHTQSPRDYGASISIAAGKCNYGNSSRYDTVKKKLAPWSSFWFLFIVVKKKYTNIFLKCVLTLIPEKLLQYSQASYWLLNVPLIYMCTKYVSVSGGYIYIILRDLSVQHYFC